MTQDEIIIAMAREAGAIKRYWGDNKEGFAFANDDQLERFVALVAAKLFTYEQVKAHIQAAVITEREACAKVCEEGETAEFYGEGYTEGFRAASTKYAAAIRARGK